MPSEDPSLLKEDINELLEGEQNIYNGASFHKYGGKIVCVSGTSSKNLISSYQANWFSKWLRHIKKFIKKHKKEIIIGVAVVVATAVVGVVIAKNVASNAAAEALVAKEKIAQAKEAAVEAGLFEEPVEESLPLAESARALGSLFAHEALDPYVIFKKDGNYFDKLGNIVKKDMPEAHIPYDEFIKLDWYGHF